MFVRVCDHLYSLKNTSDSIKSAWKSKRFLLEEESVRGKQAGYWGWYDPTKK